MTSFLPEISSAHEPESIGFGAEPRVYRVLRPSEVCARTTISMSHLRRLMDQMRFPRFEPVAARAVGLPEHELDAFLAERMDAREQLLPLGCRPPLPEWRFDESKVPSRCGIRLLRRREVEEISGLHHNTFYPLIPQGVFPGQVSLGERAVRWVAHEIETWVRGV